MILIDKTGMPVEDQWIYWNEEQHPVDPQRTVVRLDQWEVFSSHAGAMPGGLWLSGGEDNSAVYGLLDQISLVVIEFPKTRDGRGFTLARLLRERHNFPKDIRASGSLLPDQFSALIKCGFSGLLVSDSVPIQRWKDAANTLELRQYHSNTLLDRLFRGGQI
ncbi:DUF934 domain-containing protein [Pseudomonas sp. RIT-PI-q]|uniref:DUF934 domain-containing protein n=1 Tax=Pseudomonas sp. RIT-PI-q TaxID=1690247 RepID=UPI001F1DCE42|nr:DUF934 domain-containing protein [Pseudomonas sp. RIT-PI-q]